MDEFITYQTPHSIEAEQAVIGSMLIDERCVPDLLSKVEASDFYFSLNRDIFETMSAMFDAGQTIDPVLICDKLVCEDFSKAEAGKYIMELMEITPTATNALAYADIVKNKAMLRTAQDAALDAAKLVTEGAELGEVQGLFQKALETTESRQTAGAVSMTDATFTLYRELNERHKAGGSIAGLITGYKELDAMLGGLRAGNVVVLAARSGMGKSALALNIATEAAKLNKCSVLIFSLEMTAVELSERVYANYAELDMHKIRDAQLTDDEWRKLAGAAAAVSQYTVRIVEAPSLDVGEITRICRLENPALVIIDHLGLVRSSGKRRDRREAVDAISRDIKCLAKNLNIPVIVVAQLNRALTGRSNKKPVLSDLRESGAIEQDADAVLLVHRPHYFDEKADKTSASLIVAKNRHGKTGAIPMLWFGSRQHFIEDWTKGLDDAECNSADGSAQGELPL